MAHSSIRLCRFWNPAQCVCSLQCAAGGAPAALHFFTRNNNGAAPTPTRRR